MALSMQQQFDLASQAITRGDVDLISKLLTDPNSVTIDEQRTAAERLGLKGGFLAAAVNTFSDPVVWFAFLMSRRFPTLSWLRGTIPQRFMGAATEFTGVSQYTRPVETFFRGGIIPRLTSLKQLREGEVLNVGARMFGRFANRPNWNEEWPTVSLLLEGQSPAGATPELRAIAKGIRADMEELWGFLKKTQKIAGGFEGEEIRPARARDFADHEAPRHLRDYLPHIPLLGDDSIMRISGEEALRKMGQHKVAQAMQAAGVSPRQVWGPDEAGRLTSDFTRYQGWLNATQGQIFNPRLFRRVREGIPVMSQTGQELFVADLNVILEKYVHSVARTYAVNAPLTPGERALATVVREDGTRDIPTADPIIVQIINKGLEESGMTVTRRPVAGMPNVFEEMVVPGSGSPLKRMALQHLVRSVAGKADEGEILWGNLFSTIGSKFKSAAGAVSRKQESQVERAIANLRWNNNYRSVMNGVASHFYASTLGLNAWSSVQNLLQPILTTAPSIGIGPTLAGFSELRRRIPLYAREFAAQHAGMRTGAVNPLHRINESAQAAFNKVFPELAQSGIRLDPRLFDLDPNLTSTIGQSRWFRNVDDFYKFLLQPFTHAELSNQATTFFGAKHALRKALATGEYDHPIGLDGKALLGSALDKWMDFEAGQVVSSTQFRPGPGSRTLWQGRMPAPLRMFTSFPLRALSFMTESTVRGAMTQAQLENAGTLTRLTGGRNWGTLARMVLYGRIAQNGLRDVLGVDVGKAVGLTAPFTVAPAGQPFAPFPIPPVAGVAYGLVSAGMNRDLKDLQPLALPGIGDVPIPKGLIPGGIAMTRAIRAVNQWRPDLGGFADDDERLMYRGNTTDLILAMMGIPSEKNRRVRDRLERVQALRDRVRSFRRDYAVAMTNADTAKMTLLQAQWSKAFKDWPPLSITARDLKRYQANAAMPMLQRMMQQMGAAGRYLEADIYEVDPEILAPPDLVQGLMMAR